MLSVISVCRINLLAQPKLQLPDGCQLIQGDFISFIDPKLTTELQQDRSIDLIFTDPPYSIEFLPLYPELGKLAMKLLKPGANLVTYIGVYALPKIMDSLTNAGLTYNWACYVKHSGHTRAM